MPIIFLNLVAISQYLKFIVSSWVFFKKKTIGWFWGVTSWNPISNFTSLYSFAQWYDPLGLDCLNHASVIKQTKRDFSPLKRRGEEACKGGFRSCKIHCQCSPCNAVKFRFFKKATKFEKKITLVLTFMYSLTSKQVGDRFSFQFWLPSQNIWTLLHSLLLSICVKRVTIG